MFGTWLIRVLGYLQHFFWDSQNMCFGTRLGRSWELPNTVWEWGWEKVEKNGFWKIPKM
jgi:hypothetical protein